jgi:hypothetical protein
VDFRPLLHQQATLYPSSHFVHQASMFWNVVVLPFLFTFHPAPTLPLACIGHSNCPYIKFLGFRGQSGLLGRCSGTSLASSSSRLLLPSRPVSSSPRSNLAPQYSPSYHALSCVALPMGNSAFDQLLLILQPNHVVSLLHHLEGWCSRKRILLALSPDCTLLYSLVVC